MLWRYMKYVVWWFIFQLGYFAKRYLAKCTCLLCVVLGFVHVNDGEGVNMVSGVLC